MKKTIITAVIAATLSSCGIYSKYEPIVEVPDQLYGDKDSVLSLQAAPDSILTVTAAADTLSFGALDWHEIFTDALLQDLISRGLEQNTDYQSAAYRVEEASATLQAAKLAFLPSFALAPQAGVTSFDKGKATQTYSVPLNMSWEIDIFGKMRNAKQQAKALYAKSIDYRQAVRTQLIANIANTYYTLGTLREQHQLSVETEGAWKETLKSAQALMNVGRYNEAAVDQMEAAMHQVHTSVLDLEQQISQTETAMSLLLGETPRHYATSSELSLSVPETISVGVPLQMLSSRPDVRAAQRTVESAFYGVNQARANFYPSLTLSGTVGWTNNVGAIIANPGKLLASAVGALTAPLFTRGQNMAQLKIAKAQQEEAKLAFTQTLLNAGKEVNDALTGCQTAMDKDSSITAQVKSLESALRNTTLLMDYGNNTYLEILTARQSLLSAQLTQSANKLTLVQNLVNLYQALGGGEEKQPL